MVYFPHFKPGRCIREHLLFFLVEAISLSRDSLTPILLFSSLQRFVEFMVSGASSYIIGKLGKRNAYNEQKMELVRIAIGLKFCVACCIAAWIAADERMQQESEDRLMSVYLLTPQYVLLGVMGGLCGQRASIVLQVSGFRNSVQIRAAVWGIHDGCR